MTPFVPEAIDGYTNANNDNGRPAPYQEGSAHHDDGGHRSGNEVSH